MFKTVRDLANLIFALVEIVLVFRFVLKLLSANAEAGFVGWVYDTSYPLLKPFLFAFPTPSVRGGFTLEFTTLFAIFAYAFLGYVVQEMLDILAKKQR